MARKKKKVKRAPTKAAAKRVKLKKAAPKKRVKKLPELPELFVVENVIDGIPRILTRVPSLTEAITCEFSDIPMFSDLIITNPSEDNLEDFINEKYPGDPGPQVVPLKKHYRPSYTFSLEGFGVTAHRKTSDTKPTSAKQAVKLISRALAEELRGELKAAKDNVTELNHYIKVGKEKFKEEEKAIKAEIVASQKVILKLKKTAAKYGF